MKKKLHDLTIMDNFMFCAVMNDPENCRLLLERVLDMSISRVEINTEHSISYHSEYHGIRLDVYAKDSENTRYNVEMQVKKTPILKRSRYYHSQMDMMILENGDDYENLPDTYVIFICDYDPFCKGKYRYTLTQKCLEVPEIDVSNGSYIIILSNCGTNENEVSRELVEFLRYTKEGDKADNVAEAFSDPYIKRIQGSIRRIKADREMEMRYMTLELMLADERKEGLIQGKVETLLLILKTKGFLNLDLQKKIEKIEDADKLENLIVKALTENSIEHFSGEL